MDVIREIGEQYFAFMGISKFILLGAIIYTSLLLSERSQKFSRKSEGMCLPSHDVFIFLPSICILVFIALISFFWSSLFFSGWVLFALYALSLVLLFFFRKPYSNIITVLVSRNRFVSKLFSEWRFRVRGCVIGYVAGLGLLNVWIDLALKSSNIPSFNEWLVVSIVILPFLIVANGLLLFASK